MRCDIVVFYVGHPRVAIWQRWRLSTGDKPRRHSPLPSPRRKRLGSWLFPKLQLASTFLRLDRRPTALETGNSRPISLTELAHSI
jgi:hypothetical protein